MSVIFLSHSSKDNAEALAIAQWLEANGWSEYFLDVNPERGIAAGERWQEALKAAAHRCEAVVFLVSRSWLDSKWCLAEFLLAKNLGKNIFGVLIEEIDFRELPTEMTGEYQVCHLASGARQETFAVESDPLVARTQVSFSSAGLESLRIGLQDAGLEASSFPWPPENDPARIPYRGLKPLQPEDAAVYFGRDAPIIRGLDELRKIRQKRAAALLVVLGASGCGKSSLLRAGLWPRLHRDDRHFIPLPALRPARGVISGESGLATSLEKAFAAFGIARTRGELQSAIREDDGIDRLLLELRTAATKGRETIERPPSFVLGLDQGEELYIGEGTEESQRVRQWLAATLGSNGKDDAVHVIPIITIRTDLYEPLQTDELLAGIEQRIFGLKPIDRSEYRRIIEGPAQRATEAGNKLEVDPKLTEQLLKDAKGADALPLLAFTLERLFVDYGSDGDLRLDEYQTAGGVQGALEAAVDASLEGPNNSPQIPADRAEQERLLKAAFVPWLAEIDELTGERRRRQADWEELPDETRPIVERLVAARLLQRDQLGTGKTIVEVAHEALLRQWPALVRWLDADADILRATAAVVRSADAWDMNDRKLAWLDHSGERLTLTNLILQRSDLNRRLGTVGRSYLAACRQSERETADKEREQLSKIADGQRRARRLQQIVTVVLAFGVAGLSAFAVWALLERNAAEKARAQADLAALQAEDRAREAEVSKERALAAQNFAENLRVVARLESQSESQESELAAIAPKYRKQSDRHRAMADTLATQLVQWRARQGLSGSPPDSLFSLEALPAGVGASFIVHFGAPEDPHLIIVDGGRRSDYRRALGPRLSELARSGVLTIDLVVSTQSDNDHLGGLIELLKGQIEGQAPQLKIKSIWSSVSLPPSVTTDSALLSWQKSALPILASQLEIPVNLPFSHRIATSAAGAPRVSLDQGLSITVLGPPMNWIDEYHKLWMRELMKRGIVDSDVVEVLAQHHRKVEDFASDQIELIPSPIEITRIPIEQGRDQSSVNLASLVLMIERAGRRMLLTSDARQDQLTDALARAGYSNDEGKLWVDVLIVPHSGSRHNVSVEFFRRVRADYYVISTDGKMFGHPNAETLEWLFDARHDDGKLFKIVFTHEPEKFSHYNSELKAVIDGARAAGTKFELVTPKSEGASVFVDLLFSQRSSEVR